MAAADNTSGPLRIIYCGGRDYDDRWTVRTYVDAFKLGAIIVVHGGARGADALVDEAARAKGHPVEVFPADWKRHGKGAGPIRNQAMLDAGADFVVAFPGGRGTADMVRRAREAGVPVIETDRERETIVDG
jgi:hypothetical protein